MRAATSAPATQWPRLGRDPRGLDGQRRGLGDPGAGDARAHRGGHGRGAGQRDPGVVRDAAGHHHMVDQRRQSRTRSARWHGDGDADRGDAHGGAVGGAGGACLLRRGAGQDGGDGALGGGAEEVERAAFGHVALPADQGGGQFVGVDRAVPLDQEPAEQDGLLGVVGDRPGGHARGDGVAGRGGLEAGQERAPAVDDLAPGRASAWACRARPRSPARTARPGAQEVSMITKGFQYWRESKAFVIMEVLQDVLAVHLA